jgi:hypothetical protein
MSRNERIYECTIQSTNLNANKIKHELHGCGVRDVNISPCGKFVKVRIINPTSEQLAVVDKHFDSKEKFPEFKKNFKNEWNWSDSDSFDF